MIKAILFDLDGTLVCTRAGYRHSTTNKALSRFGIGKSEREMDRFWFKPGRDELIKSWGPDPVKFWRVFWTIDTIESRKKGTYPFKDCGVLRELKDLGIRLGVITGSPLPLAEMELEMVGIDFDAIIIARSKNGINPKPHPHGILECLDMLGVRPGEAVFVGNSEEDIHSAKEAGVFDILIERGEHDFEGREPSKRIKTLKELINLINKRNQEIAKES